jgi:hypothetical protein
MGKEPEPELNNFLAGAETVAKFSSNYGQEPEPEPEPYHFTFSERSRIKMLWRHNNGFLFTLLFNISS